MRPARGEGGGERGFRLEESKQKNKREAAAGWHHRLPCKSSSLKRVG